MANPFDKVNNRINNSFTSISYCILVHNEGESFKNLIEFLLSEMTVFDELIVVDDFSDEPITVDVLKTLTEKNSDRIIVRQRALNRDFAAQKNFANSLCKKEYILNLDADEMITEEFIPSIKEIIFLNKEVELYKVPRINKVYGITIEHIYKWKWGIHKLDSEKATAKFAVKSNEYLTLKQHNLVINESDANDGTGRVLVEYFEPIINFPDMQDRLYRNNTNIKWNKPVHENLVGYKTFAYLPLDKKYCILHYKKIEKQESQNTLYDEIAVQNKMHYIN